MLSRNIILEMRSLVTLSGSFLLLYSLIVPCGTVITRLEKHNATQHTNQQLDILENRGNGDINLGPVSDFQCPDGQKISSHPEYCDLYYTCYANDAVTLWKCFSDYLFDLAFYGCNFPYLVDCGTRLPPEARTTTTEQTTETMSTTNTPSTDLTSTEPTSTTSPTTELITTTTNEPVQPAPTFTCPYANGFFPISPDSCTHHYYGCIGEVPYLLRCPGDTYFDPIKYSCEEATDASCSSNLFSCSQYPSGFYPVPGSYCTNVYFSCQDGQVTEKVCPGTSLFDVTRNLCAPADTVQCYIDIQTTVSVTSDPSDQQTTSSSSNQETYSNPPDQQTTTSQTTTPPIPFECPTPNGNYANPSDCTSYFQCIAGTPFLSVCLSGTCYEPSLQDCASSCPGCSLNPFLKINTNF